jgi:hypothetical protein
MEHGAHSTPGAKRFGVNTNGFGLAVVAIVAICLALFSWSFWKDGTKEINHYRLNTLPTTPHHGDHEQGEKPGHTPSSEASATVAPSTTEIASPIDTVSKEAAADTAKAQTKDSADTTHTNH